MWSRTLKFAIMNQGKYKMNRNWIKLTYIEDQYVKLKSLIDKYGEISIHHLQREVWTMVRERYSITYQFLCSLESYWSFSLLIRQYILNISSPFLTPHGTRAWHLAKVILLNVSREKRATFNKLYFLRRYVYHYNLE